MVAAEFTSESFIRLTEPNFGLNGKKVFLIKGTSAANSDFITVQGLTTVEGAVLTATDGTAGAMAISGNVITSSNSSTKTWSGFAWGV
jgi:hypothetical protein